MTGHGQLGDGGGRWRGGLARRKVRRTADQIERISLGSGPMKGRVLGNTGEDLKGEARDLKGERGRWWRQCGRTDAVRVPAGASRGRSRSSRRSARPRAATTRRRRRTEGWWVVIILHHLHRHKFFIWHRHKFFILHRHKSIHRPCHHGHRERSTTSRCSTLCSPLPGPPGRGGRGGGRGRRPWAHDGRPARVRACPDHVDMHALPLPQ